MALVTLPTGLKGADEVLKEAFAMLGCEPWGGMSVAGWSKMSDLQRCMYRYYLKHERGLTSTFSGSASKNQDCGSFVHALLAAHYAAQLPEPYRTGEGDNEWQAYPGYRNPCPTPDQVLAALREAKAEVEALQLATGLWSGYVDHWGEDGILPVAVEMIAGDPAVHTSRYDLVFSVVDGIHDGLWIGEHKTASLPADLELWRLDGEIVGECLSWELSGLSDVFGEPLRGVCINALVKTKVPTYKRFWIPVDWNLVADFRQQRRFWEVTTTTNRKLGLWPKSYYGCKSRYDQCLFWDHCLTLSDAYLVSAKAK